MREGNRDKLSVPKQVWPGRQNTVFRENERENRTIRVNGNIAGSPPGLGCRGMTEYTDYQQSTVRAQAGQAYQGRNPVHTI